MLKQFIDSSVTGWILVMFFAFCDCVLYHIFPLHICFFFFHCFLSFLDGAFPVPGHYLSLSILCLPLSLLVQVLLLWLLFHSWFIFFLLLIQVFVLILVLDNHFLCPCLLTYVLENPLPVSEHMMCCRCLSLSHLYHCCLCSHSFVFVIWRFWLFLLVFGFFCSLLAGVSCVLNNIFKVCQSFVVLSLFSFSITSFILASIFISSTVLISVDISLYISTFILSVFLVA